MPKIQIEEKAINTPVPDEEEDEDRGIDEEIKITYLTRRFDDSVQDGCATIAPC